MIDQYGRDIHYLRLSLTERCNLKCIYCRDENEHCKGRDELKAADYERLIPAFVRLGIRKVRLTGGEPLVRRDLTRIIELLAQYPEIEDICMTTNAQGLSERLPELRNAGLKRINISMDSLQEERYRTMTRGGDLHSVMRGIDAALEAGLPVKVNAVLIRGENEPEADDFIRLAKERPIDVRFIELMPFGVLGEKGDRRVLNQEILSRHPELSPVPARYPSQPSEDYAGDGFLGRVGFISPISHKFCADCNRVRLTSDGKLRLCLGNDREIDLKPYLTEEDRLFDVMKNAVFSKPASHSFEQSFHAARRMNQIGG